MPLTLNVAIFMDAYFTLSSRARFRVRHNWNTMATSTPAETLRIDDRDVVVTNPGKVLFPQAGYTKLDVVNYYVAVAEGALRGSGDRPNILVRYPNGIGEEYFFQKR